MIRISRRRFLKTLGWSGAGTLALGSGYGFAVEPLWRLDVTRYALAPPGWPRSLTLSIAVIADLHAGGPAMPLGRIEAIVEATNALGADTVVLLGDFAASHKFKGRPIAPQDWAKALAQLRAPLGVHAVLGNHDWWDDLAAQRKLARARARPARARKEWHPRL